MNNNNQPHFIHKLSYSAREKLVGGFILIAIVILVSQAFIVGQATEIFAKKRYYHMLLNNPLGVGADTKVRVSGLDVGWIENVNLTEQNTFEITIAVYDKFHALIRQDSRASVSKLAMVGASFINITPGSINLPALNDGDNIQATEDISVDDMLSRLQPVLNQAQTSAVKISEFIQALPTEQLPSIVANVDSITANLNSVTETLLAGDSTASQLLTSDQLIRELNATLQQTQKTIALSQETLASTQQTLTALPALMAQTQQLMQKTEQQIDQIPALINNSLQLVNDTQTVVDAAANTWPLSNNIPEQESVSEPLQTLPAN